MILELRHAFRSVAASPRFAAVVIATLALGIGANTAVFGVLHAVVLTPLPYEEPERLVRVYHSSNGENSYLTGIAVRAYRDQSRTLDLAVQYTYSIEGSDLTDRAEPERVRTMPVSADYFRVLRARPILGRVFDRDDERPDVRVAVISARVWRKYFDGRPDAIGRSLSMNGIGYRVIAVLPDRFADPLESSVDVWTPLNLQPGGPNSFDNYYLSAVARLQPGATIDAAQTELAALAAAMQRDQPPERGRWSARVMPLQIDTVGSARSLLWILLGAVALLLTIACVNVASLMLARGTSRAKELAVKAALGCSGTRLVRQALIESVMLSLAGGVAGLLLSRAVSGALLAAAPPEVAHVGGGGLEGTVLVFSFAVASLAGIAFGAAPALQAIRTDLDATLRESGKGGDSRRRARARNGLVVCQIALALVLLVGAGLLLQTLERLRAVDLGIEPARVLTFEVHLPIGRYEQPERRAAFHREFQQRLRSLPGVRSAAAVSRLPATGTYHSWGAQRPNGSGRSTGAQAQQRVIEGSYFDAVGIPLLRGRSFGPEDTASAPRRVLVSEELVRELFPADDPLGQPLRVAGATAEIIGVVGDVALGPRAARRPYVYHSHSQFAGDRNWSLTQVVALDRAAANAIPTVLAGVRRELARLDPALVLFEPRLLDEVVGEGIAHERFALMLIAEFALVALALAAIGIYGVLSYSVSRRTREIGIRLALGAPPRHLRSMIVRDGGSLALIGIAIGAVVSLAATRFLQSLLFGVSPMEPAVLAAAAGVLGGAALLASWIPARAATRVDVRRTFDA
jgi:putative ABC transport system permease protein